MSGFGIIPEHFFVLVGCAYFAIFLEETQADLCQERFASSGDPIQTLGDKVKIMWINRGIQTNN